MSCFLAAGIDIIGDEKFKREWLQYYLETHPQYQDQQITAALIDKWMDGLNKSIYVTASVKNLNEIILCNWILVIKLCIKVD